MLSDWVAFDPKFFISLMLHLPWPFLNQNWGATSDGTCFLCLVYLGGFQMFSLHLILGQVEGWYLEGVEYLSLIQYLKSFH